MSEISNSRKSNVSEIWEDTGWIKDGAAVLKKDEKEVNQADNQAETETEATTNTNA
jgi:hypothetical protein